MFQRILVPVDGTTGSETVIPYAIAMAKALDAEVIVCHVVTVPSGTNASNARKLAAQYVDDVSRRFRDEGIAVKTRVRSGEPSIGIRKTAVEWEVDGIVMATRSRRRVEKLMLGSVADQVVRDSHLPVLLVSSRYEQKKRSAA
jgi:nucleotide-binding universal stress UspA family protein